MDNCEYFGCLYNDDGRCAYLEAKIKIPYYRACVQDDLDSIHTSLYGD